VFAFIGDFEKFTVRLHHAMWAPKAGVHQSGASMTGYLMKCKPGKECIDRDNWEIFRTLPRSKSGPWNHQKAVEDQKDVAALTMGDILYATTPSDGKGAKLAGLDLDSMSDACPDQCHGMAQTYRYMGMILQATIEYDNTGSIIKGSHPDHMMYAIKVYHIPQSVFNVEVVQRGANTGYGASHRAVHSLHGPRILFQAGGVVGWFSWNQLLIELTTLMIHFTVAAFVVDYFMLHCLPDAESIASLKYTDKNVMVDDLDDDHVLKKGSHTQYTRVYRRKAMEDPMG